LGGGSGKVQYCNLLGTIVSDFINHKLSLKDGETSVPLDQLRAKLVDFNPETKEDVERIYRWCKASGSRPSVKKLLVQFGFDIHQADTAQPQLRYQLRAAAID
jgi:hypothetical protein